MDNIYLRNYIEVCYIIINENVQVQKFISYFYLSNYEYNLDVERIHEIDSSFGIRMHFQTDTIHYDILDEELFRVKYCHYRAFYYRHRYTFHTQSGALLEAYIGRRCLWSSDFIKVNDIANDLCYSRSNIRNSMKTAREFLQAFDIRVDNVPYYGLATSGNEFNIRRCLLSLYSIFDINVMPIEDNYHMMRGYKAEVYDEIVMIVSRKISSYCFPIVNVEKRRIVNYLIVQNARIKSGYNIDVIPQIYTMDLKSNQILNLADSITKELQENLEYGPYSEAEIQTVAILLLIAYTNVKDVLKITEKNYDKEITIIRNEFLRYIKKSLHLDFKKDIDFMTYLDYTICILLLKHNYHILKNEATDLGGGFSLTNEYPLLGKIRQDISGMLENYFKYAIPLAQLDDLTLLVSYFISTLDFTYKKLKIAIISRSSLFEPVFLKKVIEKNVNPNYYQKLDCLLYNEALEEMNIEYDLVISDTVPQRFEARVYPYNGLKYQLNSLNDYIRTNRDLCSCTLNQVISKSINDISEILDIVNTIFSVSKQFLNEVFESANQYNRNIVLIMNDKSVNKNTLIIGDLKKKIVRDGMKCSSYILLLANLDSTNLSFFNILLHELAYDYAFLERLIRYPELCLINDQMNAVIV